MLKRPIVILSLVCFSEIVSVLTFPDYFAATICVSVIFAVLFFVYYFRKKEIAAGLIFSIIIVFSAVNPYFSYTNTEKKAERLTEEWRKNDKNIFHADITECKNYGSYSVIYANLTKANETKLDDKLKVRISSFSGLSLEEGDSIVFQGVPLKTSEIVETSFDTSTHLRSRNTFIDFSGVSIISSSDGEKSISGQLRSFTKKDYIFIYSR